VTQDHLDWHGDFSQYAAAKARIFSSNTIAVLNRDDDIVMNMQSDMDVVRTVTFGVEAPDEEDAFGVLHDTAAGGIDWLVWAEPDLEALELKAKRRRKKVDLEDEPLRLKRLMPADALRIKGRHNASNALASLALCTAIDIPMGPLLHGLREYKGEPHRMQTVAIIEGVEYINDSKGTNVGATLAALNGLGQSGSGSRSKIILIAGGEGKGQDFSPLSQALARHAKAIILIGKDASAIRSAIESSGINIHDADTLERAVESAAEIAESGDLVLLSPACASFDMFKDYAHRAQVFIDAVSELATLKGQVSA
jgi:UDP-N-acetylmuramoylalanine--D-glutamate ligase